MTLTVAVDVDSVVANLSLEWMRRINDRLGTQYTPADIKTWYWPEALGLPAKEVYAILNEPDLYDRVPDIPGALEGVKQLKHEGHRVIFVSSSVVGAFDAKHNWLGRHGFTTGSDGRGAQDPDIIFASSKDLIKADVLIDDSPSTIEKWPEWAIVYNYAYNQQLQRSTKLIRAYNWTQVVRGVQMIARKGEQDNGNTGE